MSYFGIPNPAVGQAASSVVPGAGHRDGRGELAVPAAQLLLEPPRNALDHDEQAVPAVGDIGEFIGEHFPAGAAEIVKGESNVPVGDEHGKTSSGRPVGAVLLIIIN